MTGKYQEIKKSHKNKNFKTILPNLLCSNKQVIRNKYDSKVFKWLFIKIEFIKQRKLKCGSTFHYDIFSRRIEYQNMINHIVS